MSQSAPTKRGRHLFERSTQTQTTFAQGDKPTSVLELDEYVQRTKAQCDDLRAKTSISIASTSLHQLCATVEDMVLASVGLLAILAVSFLVFCCLAC